MAQPPNNRAPGVPPFATDLPDSAYVQAPPRRHVREPVDDPNKRTSAYNMYDSYMEGNRNSGTDAVGMLMTGDMDDDDSDDEDHPTRQQQPLETHDKHAALLAAATSTQHPQRTVPLVAPKPGYAAPIAALNVSRPKPAVLNTGRSPGSEMSQVDYPSMPPTPSTAYSVPSTPHPLQAPPTPIMPVFARASPAPRDIKFANAGPIPRGNSEDTLLPRRGAKGDDFWRRFSMVVREDNRKPENEKTSIWFRQTKNRTTRLSRWIWVVALFLVMCIGLGIGVGWYFTHNDSDQTMPDAVGKFSESFTSTASAAGDATSQAIVTPTLTVQRRSDPTVIFDILQPTPNIHLTPVVHNQRSHLNRVFH